MKKEVSRRSINPPIRGSIVIIQTESNEVTDVSIPL